MAKQSYLHIESNNSDGHGQTVVNKLRQIHALNEDGNITLNLTLYMNTDLDLLKHRALRRKMFNEYLITKM